MRDRTYLRRWLPFAGHGSATANQHLFWLSTIPASDQNKGSFLSFFFKDFHSIPGFVWRLLFVFEGALEIHLRERIIRIRLEKL
jgi:hypothetical protein